MFLFRTLHRNQLVLCGLLFVVWLVTRDDALQMQLSFLLVGALISNLPPKDLFERCAQVPIDHAAWRDFFKRYNAEIEATIRRIIGYPPQGRYSYLFDDIMQRFYQRLLENERRALHALRGKEEAQARAYLRTIAAGVAFKMIAGEPPQSISLETSSGEGEEHVQVAKSWHRDRSSLTEEAILLWETVRRGLEMMLRGRNKFRNILIFKLHILDGFAPKEIMQVSGLRMGSPHAIEQLISRTRSKLRAYLRKQ